MRIGIIFLMGALIASVFVDALAEPPGPSPDAPTAGWQGGVEEPLSGPDQWSLRSSELKSLMEERSERLKRIENDSALLRRKLEEASSDSRSLQGKALGRLTALYKFKQIGYATSLLLADNPDEAMNGWRLAQRLIAADHEMLVSLMKRRKAVSELESEILQNEVEIRALKESLRACEQELLSLEDDNGASAAAQMRQKGLYAKSHSELERSLFILEKKAKNRKPIFDFDWTPFADRKGALPLPTEGETINAYASTNERASRSILHSGGIIIKAPAGQPVRAVHEGIVIFADWLTDYGNVMIIDHGNHYKTLIAHAEKLMRKTGDVVKGSDTIATVGSTGSNGEAKLYFEIRHHGKPVDPAEWLAAWK